MDELALRVARAQRWLRSPAVSTLEQAGRFVDDLGCALLFPAERIAAPSLWEAVAGEDAAPFEAGMGEAEARLWEWKDELAARGLAWYGRFLYRRGSLLSPALLAALYPGAGAADDHRRLDLSPQAHEVAEALLSGPLSTATLRHLVHDRSRYERAMGELHRNLLVTSAGVEEQRSGWPAGIVELTCRLFTVGARVDHSEAARMHLASMIVTTPRELARAFGWPLAAARAELDRLLDAGAAVQAGHDRYRAAGGPTSPPLG